MLINFSLFLIFFFQNVCSQELSVNTTEKLDLILDDLDVVNDKINQDDEFGFASSVNKNFSVNDLKIKEQDKNSQTYRKVRYPLLNPNKFNTKTNLNQIKINNTIKGGFSESDVQEATHFGLENDSNFGQTPFSSFNPDQTKTDFSIWPLNGISKKPITASEFTINSNTLNFTIGQGLENLHAINLSSTNHILPPISTSFTSVISTNSVNYNQNDPLNALQIIANPIQNLVLRSFEGFRRLLKNSHSIETYLVNKLNLPKWTTIKKLDPLRLTKSLVFEHRDIKTPLLGKLKITLENIRIIGLSNFKVESLSNQGRTLFFKHRVPQLHAIGNYTVDYYLFDEIPLRISEGHVRALMPNVYIKGSFQVLPDILNVWFKIINLNMTIWLDDVEINMYPLYMISDRFKIERSMLNKMGVAIKNTMPQISEYLKLTYYKAIEMKLV